MKALLALAAITALAPAADPPRPRITGVPHVAFYAKDPAASDRFYREFLGFQPADRFDSHRVYKINDRQFVEIYPEREAGSDRLRNIALETDDAEAMRRYLGSRGIQVPERATKNAAGNLSFEFKDPEGHTVEVVQRRTVRDTGNSAAGDRVAKRMLHAGIIVTNLEPELKFYTDVLGFREFWRGSSNGTQLSWINLRVPDGEDYIELMLYKTAPAPTARGSAHHICLEVPDLPAAAVWLEARPYRKEYTRNLEQRVGRNRRRQLNLFDPDGTRTELMEPNTVDGIPAESSAAPPPD